MLDLIITNCDIVKECSTLDISISDHLPVYLIWKKVKVPSGIIDFKGRSYKNLNKDVVENMLNNIDWTTYPNLDVDSCWDFMMSKILHILDAVCPEKHFKFAKNRPNWLTNDLINLMKERDRSLKAYLKSKSENDKKEMRRLRNLVNITVKNARAEYVKDQLETHKNNPKKFWKELNTLIPNNKAASSQCFNNIKDENDKLISQDILPNCVNSFFANIGLELDRKIPPC